MAYTIDVLRGSKSQKIKQNRHDLLSTYSIGKDKSSDAWQMLGQYLLVQGLLDEAEIENGYPVLKLNDRSWEILRKQRSIDISVPPLAKKHSGKCEFSSSTNAYLVTLQLHQQGLSVAEIAKQRNRSEGTIWQHLERLLESNQPININSLITIERQSNILEAFRTLGVDAPARDIYDHLRERYSYGEIRLIRVLYKQKFRTSESSISEVQEGDKLPSKVVLSTTRKNTQIYNPYYEENYEDETKFEEEFDSLSMIDTSVDYGYLADVSDPESYF